MKADREGGRDSFLPHSWHPAVGNFDPPATVKVAGWCQMAAGGSFLLTSPGVNKSTDLNRTERGRLLFVVPDSARRRGYHEQVCACSSGAD